MKTIISAIILVLAASQSMAELSCYEDPKTNARQCFNEKRVAEINGIRITDLYTGGPNSVDKTGFTLHVNCASQVVHIKDRQGVSFAGGNGSETKAIRNLRTWICEAKPVKAKSKN